MAVDQQFISWRERVRDPALTALLVAQCLMIFIAAPFVAAGYYGSRVLMELISLILGLLVVVVSRGWIATTIAIFATAFMVIGAPLSYFAPTTLPVILVHAGSIGTTTVLACAVASAVFAPGPINVHRVRGAIVLYLSLGMIAATGYRILWDFIPGSFNGLPVSTERWQAAGAIFYFSFITLTTIGFGDIVPVHPLARGLANLEGIIGQLYPAIVLGRLITLQLEVRRQ